MGNMYDKGEIFMSNQREDKWCFISTSWTDMNGTPYYLAWQPNTYDDGYFWTQRNIFQELKETDYNIEPHKFTFKYKKDAYNFAKSVKLKDYMIVEQLN